MANESLFGIEGKIFASEYKILKAFGLKWGMKILIDFESCSFDDGFFGDYDEKISVSFIFELRNEHIWKRTSLCSYMSSIQKSLSFLQNALTWRFFGLKFEVQPAKIVL